MARRARHSDEGFDRDLLDLPPELRWREFIGRVEAVLFASSGAVPRATLESVIAADCSLEAVLDDLRADIRGRAYEIVAIGDGYRVQTRSRYADVLRALAPKPKVTLNATEGLVLAAIAYFQPITRTQICDTLGRNISRDILASLKAVDLIANGPRSPAPGAPTTYVTAKGFLELYGLATLNDLPDFDELYAEGPRTKEPAPEKLRAILGYGEEVDVDYNGSN